MEYFADRFQRTLDKNFNDKSVSPIKRLNKLFTQLIGWYTNEFKFKSVCFAGNLCQEMGDVNTPICKTIEDLFIRSVLLFKDCLEEVLQVGEIDRSKDTERLAEAIWNSWEGGALMRMKTSGNAKSLENFKYIVFEVLLK